MRDLVERAIDGEGRIAPRGAAQGSAARGRSVTINLAESPLGWLASRGLLDPRQVEAGERLRGDHERASIAPSVTMRWAARVDGGGVDGPGCPDPTGAQIAARRRFDAAVAAVGPGLADILWRVVCAHEGLPAAEKAMGWPLRAGRIVLTLALDRLADHYGLERPQSDADAADATVNRRA